MQAEIAVQNILANTSGVTTLVGSGSSARIYYGRRVQTSTMPAITIEPDGIDPTDQKPDTTNGASKLDVEDVIVSSYGNSLTEAQGLSVAVRAALDKKTGATYNSVVVQSIQYLGQDYFNEEIEPKYHVYEDRYRLRIIR
jgi:hypothetical protein